MRDQYVDRCDLLNVINAYFSPYITCTVHMLVYNMVHIFLHGSMSGFYVFVLCLPTLWVELPLGLFGWFPLLSFRHFSLTYQHNVIGIWEGQSKTVFIFHLSPLSLKLFLALWWWMEAFYGTKMHVGRSWVWLSFRCFVFFTLSACYQFLWILHDKMGQSLSLGKHILSYFVCYIIKGKWKLLQPLALLYHSV